MRELLIRKDLISAVNIVPLKNVESEIQYHPQRTETITKTKGYWFWKREVEEDVVVEGYYGYNGYKRKTRDELKQYLTMWKTYQLINGELHIGGAITIETLTNPKNNNGEILLKTFKFADEEEFWETVYYIKAELGGDFISIEDNE